MSLQIGGSFDGSVRNGELVLQAVKTKNEGEYRKYWNFKLWAAGARTAPSKMLTFDSLLYFAFSFKSISNFYLNIWIQIRHQYNLE